MQVTRVELEVADVLDGDSELLVTLAGEERYLRKNELQKLAQHLAKVLGGDASELAALAPEPPPKVTPGELPYRWLRVTMPAKYQEHDVDMRELVPMWAEELRENELNDDDDPIYLDEESALRGAYQRLQDRAGQNQFLEWVAGNVAWDDMAEHTKIHSDPQVTDEDKEDAWDDVRNFMLVRR